jgi:hypothetical protein
MDNRKYPEQSNEMARRRKLGKEKASKDIISDFFDVTKIEGNNYPEITKLLDLSTDEFLRTKLSINKVKIMLFDILLPQYKGIDPVKYTTK